MGNDYSKLLKQQEKHHAEEMARIEKHEKERQEMQEKQFTMAMQMQEKLRQQTKEHYDMMLNMMKSQLQKETADVATAVTKQTKEQNIKLLGEKEELLKEYVILFENCKKDYENHLKKHRKIETSLKDESDKLQKKFVEKGKKDENEKKNENNDAKLDEKTNEGSEEGSSNYKDNFEEIGVSLNELRNELRSMKVIICIGKTGLGKSTFLNRISGDTSEEGNEGDFKVGEELKSETQDVSHKFITLNNIKYCIVDTPGSMDSFQKDKIHTNNIAEYLRGCGGVNAFLMFFSLAEARIDATYIDLLKLYTKMLDDNNWWKHVIIIATKYDEFLHAKRFKLNKMKDDEKGQYGEQRRQEIAGYFLKHDGLEIPKDISYLPTVPIGHDNYDEAISRLLKTIRGTKFECKNIKSSINELQSQLVISQKTLDKLKSKLDEANTKKRKMEEQVQLCKDAISKAP